MSALRNIPVVASTVMSSRKRTVSYFRCLRLGNRWYRWEADIGSIILDSMGGRRHNNVSPS